MKKGFVKFIHLSVKTKIYDYSANGMALNP
jgi:hypothetical protein